jgi:hypothetical protein
MIPSHRGRLIGLILLLLVLIWFSARQGEEVKPGGSVKTSSGVLIQKVEIIPLSPNPQSRLQAKIETTPQSSVDAAAYRYLWRVNNNEVSREASLPPGRFRQGDTVSVEVTPANNQANHQGVSAAAHPVTASVKIGNNLPVVQSITLSPNQLFTGQSVRAEVITEDKDGDFVQVHYEWQVNGMPIDNDLDTLSGDRVHSADTILVFVTPADPYGRGETKISQMINVSNRSPEIVSLPAKTDTKRFTYQVVARDPDLDPLHYILLKGPPGMEMHPTNGLIQWDIPTLTASPSYVDFEVNDGKGGKSVQHFTLATTSVKK